MLALFSCKKESTPAPGPPVISFGSFTTTNGINGVITFNFTDPDGDIGLHQEDTTGSYSKTGVGYYDFYMRYYCYSPTLGKYVTFYYPYQGQPLTSLIDSSIFAYRIPFVANNIKSKTLDGQIIINLTGYKPGNIDSLNHFRYEFWIYDRALHKSNVVTTPEFHTPY
jgi:hypothetical protein